MSSISVRVLGAVPKPEGCWEVELVLADVAHVRARYCLHDGLEPLGLAHADRTRVAAVVEAWIAEQMRSR
ncbi:MAG: hypothetical protein CMN30_27685 [Sandaracinus sp.]|nr:hypothetical protein [Sandaracinus sp.]